MTLLLNDRYELGDVLGRGGMAEVRRGRDRRLGGRIVAIKMLRTDLATDPTFRERFRREPQSAASLKHPSIVAVYDTNEDVLDGAHVPYIVMEYVEGKTLRELLHEHPRITPERALEITHGVLDALDYSHRAGIVHRDIKPGNVMITANGEVKVMDFGITLAWSAEADTDTPPGGLVGNADYLSPEQARGEALDARSDLYSTGCVLFELLTGRPPFLGDSLVSVAVSHVRENATPPSMVDPAVPHAVDAVVMKALAKDPDDRFQTATEMRSALLRITSEAPPRAAPADRPRVAKRPAIQLPTRPDPRFEPEKLLTPAPRLARAAPTQVVTIKNPEVLSHKRGQRREEDHGDEIYTFDNSKSESTSTETIRIAHTAKIEVTVEMSKTRSTSGQFGVRFLNLASAEGQIRKDILARHSLSLSQELQFEQTTAISIPASTHVKVVFHWKRVWEQGTVTLGQRARALAEVPYAITVALRFDKETLDV
jgi:serine/threonine protein kinase